MKDQDTEEIIFKSLDILGKLLEKEDPPPAEEPDMVGGGGEPPQEQLAAQEVEPDHVDHESHWSWSHNSTQTLAASVIGSIALVTVAYFHYKGKQKSKD